MSVRAWVLVSVCFLSFEAVAQSREKLPAAVLKELAEMTKTCRDVGGKPGDSSTLVTRADLTDDGVTDFVVNQAAYNCEGAASVFSMGAQGGGQVTVYVGTPDGQARQAFSDGALDVKFDKDGKPARLHVMGRGEFCGQKMSARSSRSEMKACWRPLVWNERAKKMEYAPLSQARPVT